MFDFLLRIENIEEYFKVNEKGDNLLHMIFYDMSHTDLYIMSMLKLAVILGLTPIDIILAQPVYDAFTTSVC